MKISTRSNRRSKDSSNSLPNAIAFTAIRNFLVSKEFEETRSEYCIGNLNKQQVNQVMTDVKWLFKNYKGLEVLAIEDSENKEVKFVL